MNGPAPSFFDELYTGMVKGRRGEAVLVLCDEKSGVWLHSKAFYPPHTYRLPTGGIMGHESALAGAKRELLEETGLSLEASDCLGIIHYVLHRDSVSLPFVSYVFVFQAREQMPRSGDEKEHITGFRLVRSDDLGVIGQQLAELGGRWADWGRFRAVAHEFVYSQRHRLSAKNLSVSTDFS